MRLLNLSSPQDFMALLVRRKWWIIIPFISISCAVAVLTKMLPKVFVSEATILIRPRDVPTEFVKELVGSTEARLSAIEQTVLSRTNLSKIALKFEDKLPELRNMTMDDRVVTLRKQVKLNFSTKADVGSGQLPVTYFRISYQNREPKLAQEIALEITDLFMRKDQEAREEQVHGSVVFFTDEMNKAYDDLKVSEAKVKQLKSRHRYELPTQLETLLRKSENLGNAQLTREETSLTIEEARNQLDRMIQETPPQIPKPVKPVFVEEPVAPSPDIAELRGLLAQKKDLEVKRGLGEKNPSVLEVAYQIENLKKGMSAEDIALAEKKEEKAKPKPPPAEVEMMDNPRYVDLLKQRESLQRHVVLIEKGQTKTEKELELVNKRLDNEPQVEEDLGDIDRENADLNKRYSQLKDKVAETELSLSLESKQKGSQFQILDSPNLPSDPTKPQKSVIVAVGALISLLGGIVIGFVADVANQKMWTSSDVEAFLGTTVLVEIPEIVTAADTLSARRKKWRNWFLLLAGAAAYAVFLYFIYVYQGAVIRQLDPFLQRLY